MQPLPCCLFLWPCNALVSQITTITEVQTEDLGHQATHRLALQLTQHRAQHRDPMVHTTRMMEPTLPLLPASPSKRNPLCTKEGKQLFQVPQGQIVGLQGATSLAAAQGKAPITSMARATGRERRVSTRTRGEQVDTRTALHTRAKWQEELEVIKITVTLVKCWDFKDSKKNVYLCTFSSLIVIVLVQVSTTSPVTTHREVEEVATRALVLSTTTRWATAEATAAWTTSTDRLRPAICESPAPRISVSSLLQRKWLTACLCSLPFLCLLRMCFWFVCSTCGHKTRYLDFDVSEPSCGWIYWSV